MSQLVTIKLAKPQGSPWGFRLQGGKDFATPLSIQKVNQGSVSERSGLQAGDTIVSIGGKEAFALRHKEAQDAILQAGCNFEMVVQRGSQTWKPQVTALPEAKATPDGPVVTKTSLAANQQVNGQQMTNAQYNSPVNLYSEDSIAETLSAQAEVLGKGILGINFKKYEKEAVIQTDSPTYKLIHGAGEEEPERKPRPGGDSSGFPAVKMDGQQGYYNINEKLYCDVHAKQAARHQPPVPNMEPVIVKPGATPPAGAVPASQVKPAAPPARPQPPPAATAPEPPSAPEPVVVDAPPPQPAPPKEPTPPPPAASCTEPVQEAAAPAEPAPQPSPEPAPPAPMVAPQPTPAAPRPALQQTFGAPAGDVDLRAHIPKKGGVSAPAPAPAPMKAPAPAPAPVRPAAPSLGGMPKPTMPPMGGGGGGGPTKGVAQMPGQRTAPRRGKGVMSQASATRIPMCATCQRQIRGPFVSALGKTWCPDHFICATDNCKKPLIDMGFVEEQGGLYCEDCYERFLAPICGKCDKRIKGDCLNAVGKQFHPECFCCAYCGKVFGSGAFYLEDGLPYCEADWNDLFTTKCVGCNFPIEAGDRWVEALNNNYHSQCFKCSKCHKNLEGQSFFAKGGKPFCKAHAQRGF